MSQKLKKSRRRPKIQTGKGYLQAVLIADNFQDNLSYANGIYPDALMPLANTTMLEYALQNLCTSHVQKVYLYFSRQLDRVKSCLSKIKRQFRNRIVIKAIFSNDCLSFGDAMREIHARGCITHDFILLRGSAFTTADLRDLMSAHRRQCQRDPQVAMSMVFKKFFSLRDSPVRDERVLLIFNRFNKQVVKIMKHPVGKESLISSLLSLRSMRYCRFNNNVLDTHIYMCCPAVLTLFSEQMELQTMEDFIETVAQREDDFEAKIHWQMLRDEYAMPMQSWRAYRMLTKHILSCDSYPLSPSSHPRSLEKYIVSPETPTSFRHYDATVCEGACIGEESMVGDGSVVKENCKLNATIVDARCTIGTGSILENALIFSDTRIGDDCVLENVIIFGDCAICDRTRLKNCIVMPSVTLNEPKHRTNVLLERDQRGELADRKLYELDVYKMLSLDVKNDEDEENNDDDDDNDGHVCPDSGSVAKSASDVSTMLQRRKKVKVKDRRNLHPIYKLIYLRRKPAIDRI